MNAVFPPALSALQAAQANLAGAARNIAHQQASERGIVEAMIAIRQAETAHAASAAVIRTANDMSGRLLDILA
jgi:flagellar hook-associated protein FlgK